MCNIFPSKRNATFSVSFSMIAMILRSSQNILDYSLHWVHNLCWKLITEKVFFQKIKGFFGLVKCRRIRFMTTQKSGYFLVL